MPQLLSEYLILDGDECIMGLMAKHFVEGKELPFFFYGQSYGFSLIEVSSIGLFYKLSSISDLTVKSAMLTLWIIGIVFFYMTIRDLAQKKNKWLALFITLLFIFFPSFAIWSMKARGGYISAFLLTSICTYLLLRKKQNGYFLVSFSFGFLIILIYQSQTLFLVGLIPLIAYRLYLEKSLKNLFAILSGMLLGTLSFYLLKMNLSNYWSPEVFSFNHFNLENFLSIPKKIYHHLTGSYDYSEFILPTLANRIMALCLSGYIFLSLIIGLIYKFNKRKITPLFYVSSLSVLATIAYLMLMDGNNYRYLLPLSGFVFLQLFLLLDSLDKKYNQIIQLCLMGFILLGSYSLYDFKNYATDDRKPRILSYIQHLEERGINYVYSDSGVLQWKLLFYSNERIIARYMHLVDRYPPYIQAVDRAYHDPNLKTALLGYINSRTPEAEGNLSWFKDRFFTFENPSRDLLNERGFKLNSQ